MDTSDEVARHERALAALREAARVCTECGVEPKAGTWTIRPGDSLVGAAVEYAERAHASALRRVLTIAVGDEVCVTDVSEGRRAPRTYRLVSVGRKLVKINDGGRRDDTYRIEDGVENDDYGHRRIHPDDLARINRDLVKHKVTP